MLNAVKHTFSRALPSSLRQQLRRWYYPRVVAGFSPDRWPPAPGVQRLVKPGDVVVDAGANVGYVTALLARWVGTTGRVHSFEPVPVTADLLRRSVSYLKLSHVRVHACGVSDRAGEAQMSIPCYADGGENLYESHVVRDGEPAAGQRVVSIPLCRLDDALGADVERVAFMKIDVEGHEEAALRGALGILEKSRPALLIEIMGNLDDGDSSAGRVVSLLSHFGYAPYVRENSWRARLAGESSVDYFFLTQQHLGTNA